MQQRRTNITDLRNETFDALVVGGGINGASSAAALAAQGLRTALIDRGDFAGETSQESSNLVWGGIKYLESLEFGLVSKLCASRNELIRAYPSMIKEIRFVATIEKGFRMPVPMIFAGASLYWMMGRFFTKPPKMLSRGQLAKLEPMSNVSNARGGIVYSDAYLVDNDARLVWSFIRLAMDRGARVANYVTLLSTKRTEDGYWVSELRDETDQSVFSVRSRTLVNCTGPWANELTEACHSESEYSHVLSRGVHLIVDRLTPNRHVMTFFADDGRLFFVIPMGPKSCIGTTDSRVTTAEKVVSDEDRDFILSNINKRLNLAVPLQASDVIATRSGVRPLVVKKSKHVSDKADWTQLSRKHELELNQSTGLITIFGGKLTDCVNIGNEVVAAVKECGLTPPQPTPKWYGEPDETIRTEFFNRTKLMRLDQRTAPESTEQISTRLWRRYGLGAFNLIEEIRRDHSLANVLIKGTEYLRCEIEYTERYEMITKLEDFLRRRSKIALIAKTETIYHAPGLREACEIFFGNEASSYFDEYFSQK